jgi:hypothetical protein
MCPIHQPTARVLLFKAFECNRVGVVFTHLGAVYIYDIVYTTQWLDQVEGLQIAAPKSPTEGSCLLHLLTDVVRGVYRLIQS